MYNRGIESFLQMKKVGNMKNAVQQFLDEQEIELFTANNYVDASNYIQRNWVKFASFIDQSIKNGKIKGKAVRLNYSYEEDRRRQKAVKAEFEAIKLSTEQQFLLDFVKENGAGKIQSFLAKKGHQTPAKDLNYTAKSLQWLPMINLAIEAGYPIPAEEDDGGPETW